MKKVKQALLQLGFSEKSGYFQHKDCPWFVEFVSPPAAVGKEIIAHFETLKVSTGTIQMLRPEDIVKDRLASYFHWADLQSLDQACAICQDRNVLIEEIETWAINEGFPKKFQKFLHKLKKLGSK